ncbi:hypothetical protein M378DRAFT_184273 [Amanita muscaria Koide BX008]|uniref:Uncharacterized protein n=1 Tax=Amanita muscaria (strain Koide BX008) TaxID=946122 RepID=A0A0C2TRK2_AMAMK|nr:hypothetical protein M378DRAFT_184273 [Amanita muscaria Koide BX008]
MPAEHPLSSFYDSPSLDLPSHQLAVCAKCQSTLPVISPSILVSGAVNVVCTGCRELLLLSPRDQFGPIDVREGRIVLNPAPTRIQNRDIAQTQNTRYPPESDDGPMPADTNGHRIPDSGHFTSDSTSKSSTPSRKPTLTCNTNSVLPVAPLPSHNSTPHHTSTTTLESRRQNNKCSIHAPLADITRLRVRPSSHHCLYPGATFVGTQKSGRSSYDVTVTVVDVDFASSFLCGYLRIRGLTDDWPELTTYFDAELIGSRYGFLTQNWDATEREDMVHWARFPAFKHLKPELKEPLLTMPDRERGAVFMRWKERFLVPDHHVQDINGASFAGFYYVCVDFAPPSVHSSCNGDSAEVDASSPLSPRRAGRNASRRRGRSPPMAPLSPSVATMSGYYFHQNSEPYQQLSLTHVPERTSSSFEFR